MLIAKTPDGKSPNFEGFRGTDYVVVELRWDSPVAVSKSGFQAPAAARPSANSLNEILEGFRIKAVDSHFGLSRRALTGRSVAAPSAMPETVSSEFAQSGVMQVVPQSAKHCDDLVEALSASPSIWKRMSPHNPFPRHFRPTLNRAKAISVPLQSV